MAFSATNGAVALTVSMVLCSNSVLGIVISVIFIISLKVQYTKIIKSKLDIVSQHPTSYINYNNLTLTIMKMCIQQLICAWQQDKHFCVLLFESGMELKCKKCST